MVPLIEGYSISLSRGLATTNPKPRCCDIWSGLQFEGFPCLFDYQASINKGDLQRHLDVRLTVVMRSSSTDCFPSPLGGVAVLINRAIKPRSNRIHEHIWGSTLDVGSTLSEGDLKNLLIFLSIKQNRVQLTRVRIQRSNQTSQQTLEGIDSVQIWNGFCP